MRAITVTAGLVLAAGTLAVAAPALAATTTATTDSTRTATAAPQTAEKRAEARKQLAAKQLSDEQTSEAIRQKLAAVTDPAERRHLEAELKRQVSAVPRGGADTGVADTTGEATSWELIPLVAGGAVLAGVAGTVVVRRRRWLQPA